MPAPPLPGVDWREAKRLALLIGCREAARQMGISETSVKSRSTREGWLDERNAAKAALHPDRQKQLVAIATNATLEQVNAIPTVESVIASNASKSKIKAGNVALRALERLERCEDDELIQSSTADVALKYTGMAAKAGGWAERQQQQDQPVINVNLLCMAPQDRPVIEQEGA